MSSPSDRPTYRPPSASTARPQLSGGGGDPGEAVVADETDDADERDRPTLVNFALPFARQPAPGGDSPEVFRVLAGVIDKAATMGNVDAVALAVTSQLARVADESEAGGPIAKDTVDAAARCAMKLASATSSGAWVNVVLRIYRARAELLPVELVDALYTVLRNTRGVDWSLFSDYVDLLRTRSSRMSPPERFAVKRIEGLLQLGPG